MFSYHVLVVQTVLVGRQLSDILTQWPAQIDSEERCDNTSLLHPCTGGERFCSSPVDVDSCCHLVVKFQDCDEVDRTTKSGQNFSESFTVDGVEGLSQVRESRVKILVLFPTFVSDSGSLR